MDKDHASTIAISRILNKLNILPEYIGKSKALYRSPFTKEHKPGFWIYFKTNSWYDYTISAGGDLQEFSRQYLKFTGEAHTSVDVSRWITNLTDSKFSYPQVSNEAHSAGHADSPELEIKSETQIRLWGLIRYLENLGISLSVAQRHTKELKVFNRKSGRTFIALGIKNENGGYDIRNPVFHGFTQPGGITFFRGMTPTSQDVHVFKDIFDFLSVLTHLGYDRWEHDTIILHANSNAPLAAPYVRNYGYNAMYTWMDNDEPGRKATAILHGFLMNQPGLVHLKMNRVYEDFLSVNAWHVAIFRMLNQPV